MPDLFPTTMRHNIGIRVQELQSAHAERDLANKKKVLSKSEVARKLLGSTAKVSDLEKLESGDFALTDNIVEEIASYFRVPADWLKHGNTKFDADEIVRIPGVGRRVTEARMSCGLTYIELSRKAKMGHTSRNVARIEDAVHWPRSSTIQRIAAACGVPTNFILFGHA